MSIFGCGQWCCHGTRKAPLTPEMPNLAQHGLGRQPLVVGLPGPWSAARVVGLAPTPRFGVGSPPTAARPLPPMPACHALAVCWRRPAWPLNTLRSALSRGRPSNAEVWNLLNSAPTKNFADPGPVGHLGVGQQELPVAGEPGPSGYAAPSWRRELADAGLVHQRPEASGTAPPSWPPGPSTPSWAGVGRRLLREHGRGRCARLMKNGNDTITALACSALR